MRLACALALVLAMAGIASADNVEEARHHLDAGNTHLSAGNYERAVLEFKAAYDLAPAPGLLFNIAQAYRAAKDYDHAEIFYTSFLREDPTDSERDYVLDRMGEMKEERARSAGHVVSVAPAPGVRALPAPPSGEPRSLGLAWAGVAVAGSGAVLVGTGLFFGARAANASDEISTLFAGGGTWNDHYRQVYDDGKRDGMLSGLFVGVGAGAMIAGGVMSYLGFKHHLPPSATIAVLRIHHGTGLGVSCAF